jgi:hypothetical protein
MVRQGQSIGVRKVQQNKTMINRNDSNSSIVDITNSDEPVFFITVNGTHCWVQEPKDENLPINKK